ncbi:MAG: glucose-6-phosphate dehydrogenase [Solirubrobacteraceae bacterium]
MTHHGGAAGERGTDALVIFGITGDLARQMTFRALYRLERRGLLECPIVGVARAEMDDDGLRARAHEALREGDEQLDEKVLDSLGSRLRYVRGDLGEPETYARVGSALGDAASPIFYLETPPSTFAQVVAGLDDAQLLSNGGRVLVEKPFGLDLASARNLSSELHRHLDESQLYRIDHFLGKSGLDEILYLRFTNEMLEPVWNRHHLACVQITMAEAFGVEERGSFFDPVGALRDDVVNHMLQLTVAAAMEAPSGPDADALQDAKRVLLRSTEDADPDRYVRGQYERYREIDGVADDSSTETYAALELRIDNWRWSGVPFLLRTGKRLATTETELRLVFKRPPTPLFLAPDDRGRPQPAQLVVALDPSPGLKIVLDVHRADGTSPRPLPLEAEFPQEGGGAQTPYEILLGAAIRGDRSHFAQQDYVEECWRIVQPLMDSPGPVHTYRQGSWGPNAADELAAPFGGWRGPGATGEA